MDVRQLEHLVALIDLGSVHAAAEAMHISQPGLSTSIKRLETELGIQLFNRSGRRITPNDSGRSYYRHAKLALAQLRLGRAELQGSHTYTNLRIGLGESIGSLLIGHLTRGLTQLYPSIELIFTEAGYETLTPQLENGDLDLAIMGVPTTFSSSLTFQTLIPTRLVLCCASSNPLAKKKGKIHRDQLADQTWVKNNRAPNFFRATSRHERRHMTVDSAHAAKELILSSECLCLLPILLVLREVQNGSISILETDYPAQPLNVSAIYREDAMNPVIANAISTVTTFLELHRDELAS